MSEADARLLERERLKPGPKPAPPPSGQLRDLMRHLKHYAVGAKVDPDTLGAGFALLCVRFKEKNPIVALEMLFDTMVEQRAAPSLGVRRAKRVCRAEDAPA